MYTTFFGFNGKPFVLTSDPQVFYTNPAYQRAYATLLYGLCERKDLIVFTGEVGTGKTTFLRRITQHLEDTARFLFFSYTTLPFDDLVSFLCQELQVPVKETARRHQKILALKDVLLSRARAGHRTVLVIDEAQNLEEETLTALVSLCLGKTLAEPLLPLVLAGQPEFDALLKRASLRQVSQRVALYCRLERLSDEEVAPYILHRLRAVGHEQQDIFTSQAVQRIVMYAAGIPRKVNLLCDNALLLAYSDRQKTVSAEMIDEIADDFLLPPASSAADPDPLFRDTDTQSDELSTVNSPLTHWQKEELRERSLTARRNLSRWVREYQLPQVRWLEGGLVLTLLFLFLLPHTTSDMIRLSAVEPTPRQALILPPFSSQAVSEFSLPTPTLPERKTQPLSLTIQSQNPPNEKIETAHPREERDTRETSSPLTALSQPTQDQPPSRQSPPQPPNTIHPPSEQTSSEYHKPPRPKARKELETPSQKPTSSDPSLPVLLARAEQRVASLREAAEGLTIEIDRLNEGAERTPRGTRNARRATFLLNRAQRHTDALSQALLHLENNPTDQTPLASTRVTTLLKQTQHYETLLRTTATRLHAEARQQSKEVLQDQIPQPALVEVAHDQQPERPDMDIAQTPQAVTPTERAEVIPPQQYAEFSLPTPPTRRDGPDESPLMLAALRGDMDAVDRLIAQGAEVNNTNRAGGTALMTAAIQGHSDVVRLLISKRATVNAKNNKGWTALMYAAWNGHTDVVKTLLAKGAEVNAQNNEGWTALMYATWKGQIETVQVLLAGRALVATPNQAGESALTLAAHHGYADITALLNDADGKQ